MTYAYHTRREVFSYLHSTLSILGISSKLGIHHELLNFGAYFGLILDQANTAHLKKMLNLVEFIATGSTLAVSGYLFISPTVEVF